MIVALSSAQLWIIGVAAVLFGAAVGSFACVIIERLPVLLDEPHESGDLYDTRPWGEVLGGNSRCTSCAAPIRWFHKVPVFSWIALRGKCSTCGDHIPGFHPIVEFLVPAVGAAVVWSWGWDWRIVPLLWLVPIGIIVSAIDLRTFIVPTRVVWPAFFASVAMSVGVAAIEGEWGWLWGAMLGLLMVAGPLFVLFMLLPGGMGFGDVRLATLLGWTVGFTVYTGSWSSVAFYAAFLLAASAVVGIVMGVGGMMTMGRKAKVPFAPALLISGLSLMIFAQQLTEGFGIA